MGQLAKTMTGLLLLGALVAVFWIAGNVRPNNTLEPPMRGACGSGLWVILEDGETQRHIPRAYDPNVEVNGPVIPYLVTWEFQGGVLTVDDAQGDAAKATSYGPDDLEGFACRFGGREGSSLGVTWGSVPEGLLGQQHGCVRVAYCMSSAARAAGRINRAADRRPGSKPMREIILECRQKYPDDDCKQVDR